jgi:hypothetical protein
MFVAEQIRYGAEGNCVNDIVAAILSNISTGKAEAIGKGLIAGAKRKQQRSAG